MSYKKANHVLPAGLLEQVQKYIDGEFLYIPRALAHRKAWGEGTAAREELRIRNHQIYADYLCGMSVNLLADRYYLSPKSIQRIIGQQKKTCSFHKRV